ncbi:MAG: type I phosphomannose isomerase catalytic subunit [Planctomycetota bacterium]
MSVPDYPLLLAPDLHVRAWGGSRLGDGVGEAWDLSVHAHGPSTVRNGALSGTRLSDVVEAHPEAFGGPVRLLAKRLDCKEALSVQVHPRTHDPKTEAWVVLEADPGAGVYHGFLGAPTRGEVRRAAEEGSLPSLLRFVAVERGDVVLVPAGTVHAIGGGLFLFEIQQSADTTYRLFDWGRGRELHLDHALGAAALDPREPRPAARPLDGGERLVATEHFTVDRVAGGEPVAIDPGGAWKAAFLAEGSAAVDGVPLGPGETVLVPGAAGVRTLEPAAACLLLLYGPVPPG